MRQLPLFTQTEPPSSVWLQWHACIFRGGAALGLGRSCVRTVSRRSLRMPRQCLVRATRFDSTCTNPPEPSSQPLPMWRLQRERQCKFSQVETMPSFEPPFADPMLFGMMHRA
jgi:hypothetical protein